MATFEPMNDADARSIGNRALAGVLHNNTAPVQAAQTEPQMGANNAAAPHGYDYMRDGDGIWQQCDVVSHDNGQYTVISRITGIQDTVGPDRYRHSETVLPYGVHNDAQLVEKRRVIYQSVAPQTGQPAAMQYYPVMYTPSNAMMAQQPQMMAQQMPPNVAPQQAAEQPAQQASEPTSGTSQEPVQSQQQPQTNSANETQRASQEQATSDAGDAESGETVTGEGEQSAEVADNTDAAESVADTEGADNAAEEASENEASEQQSQDGGTHSEEPSANDANQGGESESAESAENTAAQNEPESEPQKGQTEAAKDAPHDEGAESGQQTEQQTAQQNEQPKHQPETVPESGPIEGHVDEAQSAKLVEQMERANTGEEPRDKDGDAKNQQRIEAAQAIAPKETGETVEQPQREYGYDGAQTVSSVSVDEVRNRPMTLEKTGAQNKGTKPKGQKQSDVNLLHPTERDVKSSGDESVSTKKVDGETISISKKIDIPDEIVDKVVEIAKGIGLKFDDDDEALIGQDEYGNKVRILNVTSRITRVFLSVAVGLYDAKWMNAWEKELAATIRDKRFSVASIDDVQQAETSIAGAQKQTNDKLSSVTSQLERTNMLIELLVGFNTGYIKGQMPRDVQQFDVSHIDGFYEWHNKLDANMNDIQQQMRRDAGRVHPRQAERDEKKRAKQGDQ